jgi:arylsulfatase A-like enzyme/Flp pilus assembly protein TadD
MNIRPGTTAPSIQLALALATAMLFAACSRENRARDTVFRGAPVIIVSIDTLRADHLPAYGYTGVETPIIDGFRKDSILFRNAWAHVPLTLPSHATILTGLLPHDAGVQNNIGYRLEPGVRTLTGLLHEGGYATGAAVSAWVLRKETGIGAGFDFYDDRVELAGSEAAGRVQRAGEETSAAAVRWIESNRQEPFFFMLHLFEPHAPWEPPASIAARYPGRPYDGEIAHVDAILGGFFGELRRLGVYDRALIVLLSDHGEGLGDHGEQEHGIFLYREAIHVPLMIKLPGQAHAGAVVASNVGLIDIAPTIAAAAGLELEGAAGKPLLPLVDAPEREERAIYSETFYPRIHLGWSELRSLVEGTSHYIDAPRAELYDLAADPGEARNLLGDERRRAARMREALASYPAELRQPSSVSPEEAAKLQSLGYLGGTSSSDGPLPDPKDRLQDLAEVQRATALISGGRLPEAIAILTRVVAANPRFTDAVMLLARAHEEAGEAEEALGAYRRAIELNPSNAAGPAISAGWLYLRIGDLQNAASHAELAIAEHPAQARLLLGWIALARGDAARAETLAREAMQNPTYRARSSVLLAQGLARRGELTAALEAIERARQETGAAPTPLLEFTRGDILIKMNRPAEGERAFRNEIRHFPRDPQAYANLTVLYLLQGRKGEAERTMESLIAASPSAAHYALAERTFRELGETALADRWKRRAPLPASGERE